MNGHREFLYALFAAAAMVDAPTVASGAEHPLPPPGRSEFIVVEPGAVERRSARMRFQRGDDPRWADPAFDDSAWEVREHVDGLPAHTGIYWVRFTLRQPERPRRPLDGLSVAVVASYELFIDGQLVGRSGTVGATREDEVPGSIDNLFRIPDVLLTPGPHLVAVRMSAWRSGFPIDIMRLNLAVGPFRELVERRVRRATLSILAIGGALALGVVFGLWWLMVERRRALLLFSLAGFAAAGMQFLQAWRWLWDYPFDWHYPRLVVIAATGSLLSVVLVAALLEFFGSRRRPLFLLAFVAMVAGAWVFNRGWYNTISFAALALALLSGLVIAIRAIWLRERGAALVLIGLAVGLAYVGRDPSEFLEQSFFVTFGAPMLGCTAAVVLRLRDERRAARQAQLTAARLEIELLKKQIQPHFVLNTLTTIMEVIEQAPRTAVTLIDALAGEFRLLARMSGERLIPLAQELELCRTHLQIMSLRRDVSYSLETQVVGLGDAELVPPALLLTLIENGLTHQHARRHEVVFRLTGAVGEDGGARYVFFAPGVSDASEPPGNDGTGLRYVKARLEESYGGRWSLQSGAVAGGWETVIEIGRAHP